MHQTHPYPLWSASNRIIQVIPLPDRSIVIPCKQIHAAYQSPPGEVTWSDIVEYFLELGGTYQGNLEDLDPSIVIEDEYVATLYVVLFLVYLHHRLFPKDEEARSLLLPIVQHSVSDEDIAHWLINIETDIIQAKDIKIHHVAAKYEEDNTPYFAQWLGTMWGENDDTLSRPFGSIERHLHSRNQINETIVKQQQEQLNLFIEKKIYEEAKLRESNAVQLIAEEEEAEKMKEVKRVKKKAHKARKRKPTLPPPQDEEEFSFIHGVKLKVKKGVTRYQPLNDDDCCQCNVEDRIATLHHDQNVKILQVVFKCACKL